MVWESFCGAPKSELVIVPGEMRLDTEAYVGTIVEPHLAHLKQQCYEEYGRVQVVEDGAPGHKKYAIQYRELNGLESLQ